MEFEGDGRVKKREASEYTFFYLNGHEVTTLVKKDGKELSAEDQKKENDKTRKRIEELQKREAKKEAKEEKARQAGKEEDKDEPGIEVFLRACQFVNPRCERFAGWTCWCSISSQIRISSRASWWRKCAETCRGRVGRRKSAPGSPAGGLFRRRCKRLLAACSRICKKEPALCSSRLL